VLVFRGRDVHTHFVGIGGIGMSGIAEVLLNLGYRVTGSDLKEGETTRRLAQLGATIRIGHKRDHLGDADVVVVSSAVRSDNPEVMAARQRKIPVIPRAEMLAELMRMKYGVAIAGSHGKTTTTSLVAEVLVAGGLDPTAVIGGKLAAFGSNARLGQGSYLVAEADESDGSFLRLAPTVAVVTNIDPEHLDHYGDVASLERAFAEFVSRVPFFGVAVLCLDHPRVQALLPGCEKRVLTYGLSPQADYRAEAIRPAGRAMHFQAVVRGQPLGEVRLGIPGVHNVSNALATLAVADFLGVPFDVYRTTLEKFGGVARRFTIRGEVGGVLVVDDYGHHPAEVRATLAAARAGFTQRLVVAFQPHRYTRLQSLLEDFAVAFHDADEVIVCDVYAAGEEPIPGISAATLVDAMRARGHRSVTHVASRAEVARFAAQRARPGDLFLTLGAGDIWQSGDELLRLLGVQEASV
jgi:UDP-N-acetylmuramate--alanine ligase